MTTLRYIGHSAFLIEHDGLTIAVDPFITGNPSATISAEDVAPDYIFLTHAHNDHVGDTVELSKRTNAPVISTFELGNYLASKGATTEAMNHGGTYRFDGGSVKLTPAWHTSSYEEGSEDGTVVAPGIPAGLIVTLGEDDKRKKVYFAGDTCLFLDMQLIGDEELDVAVLPIGDYYTMGPEDAIRSVKYLRPKFVLPCHYNTFSLIEQDAEAFKSDLEKETNAKGIVLQPGDRWEIE